MFQRKHQVVAVILRYASNIESILWRFAFMYMFNVMCNCHKWWHQWLRIVESRCFRVHDSLLVLLLTSTVLIWFMINLSQILGCILMGYMVCYLHDTLEETDAQGMSGLILAWRVESDWRHPVTHVKEMDTVSIELGPLRPHHVVQRSQCWLS